MFESFVIIINNNNNQKMDLILSCNYSHKYQTLLSVILIFDRPIVYKISQKRYNFQILFPARYSRILASPRQNMN